MSLFKTFQKHASFLNYSKFKSLVQIRKSKLKQYLQIFTKQTDTGSGACSEKDDLQRSVFQRGSKPLGFLRLRELSLKRGKRLKRG